MTVISKLSARGQNIVKVLVLFGLILTARRIIDQVIRKVYKYPPGHNGLPFIGSVYSIIISAIKFSRVRQNSIQFKKSSLFDEISKKYGKIAMIQLGISNAIIISDVKLCKKLFNKNDFMNHSLTIANNFDPFGVINGPKMFYRRNLIHNSFMMTLNSNYLRNNICKNFTTVVFPKLDKLCDNYDDSDDRIDNSTRNCNDAIRDALHYTVFSLIFKAIFGNLNNNVPRIDSDDFGRYNKNNEKFRFMGVILLLESLGYDKIPFVVRTIHYLCETEKLCKESSDIIDKWVKDARVNYHLCNKSDCENSNKHNYNCNCTIAAMFERINITGARVGEHENKFKKSNYNCKIAMTKQDMVDDISSLFMAGLDTTTLFTVKILEKLSSKECKHLQDIIYNEIITNCVAAASNKNSNSGNCTTKHNYNQNSNVNIWSINATRLPLLRAFIQESIRCVLAPAAIFSIPRTVIRDGVKIDEYNIPKGSKIIANYPGFMRDETLWKQAEKFDIKNWLAVEKKMHTKSKSQGNKVENNDDDDVEIKLEIGGKYQFVYNSAFSAFGFGKRNCPGQALAMRMMIIMLVYLIQRYQFYNDENCKTFKMKKRE